MHGMATALDSIVGFIRSIGIPVQQGQVGDDAFLPGVRIVAGGLVFDPQRLRWPSDLLHEAGHIAVTPADLRAGLDDALESSAIAPHAGEVEAMAWSWAAALHLGLPPEQLFHPDGYKGQSAGLLMSYSLGVCPGAFGLSQAGMTALGETALAAGVQPYPHMQRWLRDSTHESVEVPVSRNLSASLAPWRGEDPSR